ncbi:tRNA lysidine(34) synthetase TilS [Companilactobacillus sp.]|jgi:tRNA(Ile)-lysidine synthase|uniref:tRNA lysidine(34) synthetase TilS n=1 Tax=Companilactobacillus sp. TaxID=2767905 RepID=UPI0025B81915|nr:tRNA lysidine(34) synthetase TilS [Companilactobacillus sp.]MCH4010156.1 tRNA lysidine(34) synthetase TilS [Companilactobacillus sp.]MCH4052168.1 tRNA lysidine(34) synthetase TilS [Companilactobacillus sp.]MCH4078098.1 tRNA lysidine(34) synthetase TilS [Companilactobacillus sp.]MCH4126674.1 tRNA lysidine(34) synthetase TilS [Companilactobacillus sp.]MCH4132259.1 tRNA lysidine(34) synthetase TilS [Companilactobacillus sp.]
MTHEVNMVSSVKKFLKANQAKRVLIAVSGGIDSMVLTDILLRIWNKADLAVVNVDHDLRPESRSEVEFVQQYCQKQSIAFYTAKWNHDSDGLGMEAAAREFRYNFFQRIMQEQNFDTLLTAHHANDLSENVLMKLIRSGNVYEVTSLKKRRDFSVGQLLRPLLEYSKSELREYSDERQLKHIQDETNFENITMRNRLRNDIFPQLQKENGQLLKHFNLFESQLNALIKLADTQFSQIEDAMQLQYQPDQLSGELIPLSQLDDSQQTLFWGRMFTNKFPKLSISNRQIQQIITIVTGQKPNTEVNLENGWNFERAYTKFYLKKIQQYSGFDLPVEIGKEYRVNGRIFKLEPATADTATIAFSHRPKQIVLRTRKNGDKLLINNSKHQKLSKRFINEKIPEDKRRNLPILIFDNEIVWVEKIYNIGDYLKKNTVFYKITFKEVK